MSKPAFATPISCTHHQPYDESFLIAADHELILSTRDAKPEELAAIVRAVNGEQALRIALESMLHYIQSNINSNPDYADMQLDDIPECQRARAALDDTDRAPINGQTFRNAEGRKTCRMSYQPAGHPSKPWLAFVNGECMNHFPTARAAADYFREKHNIAVNLPTNYNF